MPHVAARDPLPQAPARTPVPRFPDHAQPLKKGGRAAHPLTAPPRAHRAQGFTLTELVVVMAILGAVIILLLPNLIATRDLARDTGAFVCARSLWHEAQATHVDDESLPYPSAQTLLTGPPTLRSCQDPALQVQTLPTNTDTFTYTVEHARGTVRVTATPEGLTRAPR
jgi:prepilin-type N-terminal cleavage/methylation domain-containing protein